MGKPKTKATAPPPTVADSPRRIVPDPTPRIDLPNLSAAAIAEHDVVHGSPLPVIAKPPPEPMKGRLPAGSAFAATWDGVKWIGELRVPPANIFETNHQSLTKLCYRLDDLYRCHLQAQAAKETPNG